MRSGKEGDGLIYNMDGEVRHVIITPWMVIKRGRLWELPFFGFAFYIFLDLIGVF